jgi:hypothetical protein
MIINKHCLEAFNKLDKPVYHPQEYFVLGWNAAIDALAEAYQRQWEEDGINTQLIRTTDQEPMPDDDKE